MDRDTRDARPPGNVCAGSRVYYIFYVVSLNVAIFFSCQPDVSALLLHCSFNFGSINNVYQTRKPGLSELIA